MQVHHFITTTTARQERVQVRFRTWARATDSGRHHVIAPPKAWAVPKASFFDSYPPARWQGHLAGHNASDFSMERL
jgi:hypothetical protein